MKGQKNQYFQKLILDLKEQEFRKYNCATGTQCIVQNAQSRIGMVDGKVVTNYYLLAVLKAGGWF